MGEERPPLAATPLPQAFLIVGLLALLWLWLAAVGRPLLCSCGTVRLFVADAASPENSQQFADFYSLLHMVFGLALWIFLDWMKPHWSTGQKLVIAVASSVAWEAVENLPFVIALFGNAPGSPTYGGDTILNALADTLFVGLGFFVARALPLAATIGLAILFEAVVALTISDGLVLGTLRLFGAKF